MIDITILADRSLDPVPAFLPGNAPGGNAPGGNAPGGKAPATGLLRCLGALAAEAGEHGMPRTAAALYQALGIGLRESLDAGPKRRAP